MAQPRSRIRVLSLPLSALGSTLVLLYFTVAERKTDPVQLPSLEPQASRWAVEAPEPGKVTVRGPAPADATASRPAPRPQQRHPGTPSPYPREQGSERISLVSYGTGGVYRRSLADMNRSWRAAGFHRAYLWGDVEVTADPIYSKHAKGFLALNRSTQLCRHKRPFCAGFKPLMLLRAFEDSRDGDFVVWADASQYHNMSLMPGINEAIHMLTTKVKMFEKAMDFVTPQWQRTRWYQELELGRQNQVPPRNLYGSLHCWFSCSPNLQEPLYLHSRDTPPAVTMVNWANLTGKDVDAFIRGPHILNSLMIFENTAFNRQLVWDWLQMGFADPRAFCTPHQQDQMAFTLLAFSRDLPLVNLCPYQRRETDMEGCRVQKKYNAIIPMLARGMFEMVPSGTFPEKQR